MRGADPLRRAAGSRRLPALLGLTLALQLTTAAGAVAGPWAVTSVSAPRPAVVPAAVPIPAAPPVLLAAAPVLSAPGLWPGDVEAMPLSVDADGRLEVPQTADALGWWSAGPRPGEPGAAVLVGHVDLDGRPGVFARLARARIGDSVVVRGPAGAPIAFRVTRVRQVAKDAFPADEVYRPTAGPELRLITCGGRFDPSTGHYVDNVVVDAVRA